MNKPAAPKKILDKRIPTLIGMVVLVVALISGSLLIGKGGGVFAPRASAETTPKNVKITNVHDTNFTISFLTDLETAGFIKYGTDSNSLKSQAGDDRDQISGTVGSFKTHHITVRGLQPSTAYYYTIGTGSGSTFDDNGKPFQIRTAARNGSPAAAKTIYGSVTNEAGGPANGAIVYVDVNGAGTMSSQVKTSGSWAIPLSNARTLDGSAYATISDTDSIIINAQGSLPTQVSSLTTTVANSQPVPGIQFGQTTVVPEESLAEVPEEEEEDIFAAPDSTLTPEPEEEEEDIFAAPDSTLTPEPEEEESDIFAAPESTLTPEPEEEEELSGSAEVQPTTELDLELDQHQTVTTSKPLITGTAIPNAVITITVNSDTQIQQDVTANSDGDFQLDIAQLSESLEPGEHTVTYSYVDPTTGQLIEKTVTFTVDAPVQQLAQADTSPTPYSSESPYPVETPTPTPTPTLTPTPATESAEATDSGRTSQPATDEGVPVSGSVGTTLALVFGGLFFIISGLWSFWISTQLDKEEF